VSLKLRVPAANFKVLKGTPVLDPPVVILKTNSKLKSANMQSSEILYANEVP